MTFYQVEFWEDGQRSAHYVSSKKTAAELVSRIRQSGVDEIQVARVRLDSLTKRVLLRALQAAANGHSFADIATVDDWSCRDLCSPRCLCPEYCYSCAAPLTEGNNTGFCGHCSGER